MASIVLPGSEDATNNPGEGLTKGFSSITKDVSKNEELKLSHHDMDIYKNVVSELW